MNADNTPATEPDSKAAAEAKALSDARKAAAPGTAAVPAPSPVASQTPATPAAGDTSASQDVSSMTREQLEARIKTLTQSLASANTESEFFRKQWQDLRLRDEALGVEALTADQSKMADKLVQAVKECYQSEMKRKEAINILGRLLATTNKLIQTAPKYDPKVRADYEVATRAASDYIAGHFAASIPLASSISDAKISDVNPDLNVVILNVGKSQGVKEGMIFALFQDSQQVASVKVVLARDLVCAAMVQDVQPKVVLKVGDRAEISTGQ